MEIGTILAIAALTTSTAGAVISGQQSRKAERARSRMEARQARRERVQMLREQQAAQAQIRARAIATGTADSSGAEGALAGAAASTAGNISFSNIQQSAALNIRNTIASGNRRASNMGMLSNLLQAGATLYNAGAFNPSASEQSQKLGASQQGYSPKYMQGWGR